LIIVAEGGRGWKIRGRRSAFNGVVAKGWGRRQVGHGRRSGWLVLGLFLVLIIVAEGWGRRKIRSGRGSVVTGVVAKGWRRRKIRSGWCG